jgi:SAM-dependent methyltransferase
MGLAMRVLARLGVLNQQQAETRWPRQILRRNLARPLEWENASARAIYSSHMVEHLDRAEARRFLEECRRVLKPGGVLRLVLPNLKALVEHYEGAKAAGDPCAADEFVELLYLVPRDVDPPPLRRMALLFLHRAHRWMYDPDSMQALLREVGFGRVRECSFRAGACPGLDTLETRESDLYDSSSFYVEGFKA